MSCSVTHYGCFQAVGEDDGVGPCGYASRRSDPLCNGCTRRSERSLFWVVWLMLAGALALSVYLFPPP